MLAYLPKDVTRDRALHPTRQTSQMQIIGAPFVGIRRLRIAKRIAAKTIINSSTLIPTREKRPAMNGAIAKTPTVKTAAQAPARWEVGISEAARSKEIRLSKFYRAHKISRPQ